MLQLFHCHCFGHMSCSGCWGRQGLNVNSEDAPVGTSSSVPKSVCQDWHSRCSSPNLRAVLAKMFFTSSLTHDVYQHFE